MSVAIECILLWEGVSDRKTFRQAQVRDRQSHAGPPTIQYPGFQATDSVGARAGPTSHRMLGQEQEFRSTNVYCECVYVIQLFNSRVVNHDIEAEGTNRGDGLYTLQQGIERFASDLFVGCTHAIDRNSYEVDISTKFASELFVNSMSMGS